MHMLPRVKQMLLTVFMSTNRRRLRRGRRRVFFNLGTCPEAIIFTLVLAETFRDMLLPAGLNMQPHWMISSLLLGEGKRKYRIYME